VALRPGAQRRERRSVAEFLSDEWIRALGHAARAAGDSGTDDAVLVVEPVVRAVPGRGEVRYRVMCDTTVRDVTDASESDGPADVRLETDYPTAAALARGELNAQTALADGRLTVTGDVARLAGYAAAVAKLGDLFAAVRASTTFPAPADGAEPRS
jgi:ubiquinone biosynthesis protein UbiJ